MCQSHQHLSGVIFVAVTKENEVPILNLGAQAKHTISKVWNHAKCISLTGIHELEMVNIVLLLFRSGKLIGQFTYFILVLLISITSDLIPKYRKQEAINVSWPTLHK